MATIAYSIGGIHPTEGDLAYAAYACFRSREDAEIAQCELKKFSGPLWALSDIMQTRVNFDVSDLPDVHTWVASQRKLHSSCASA